MNLTYSFGPFTLDMPSMELKHTGAPVKLGARALRLVVALAEARGDLLHRNALLEEVWGGQAIDESALRVHLSAARKVLDALAGQPTIVNEAGRGYRLALTVTTQGPEASKNEDMPTLPLRLTSIIGRDAVIAELCEALSAHKLLTIAGAGGMGKTTVGIEVARHVSTQLAVKPVLVELAPLNDPAHVTSSLAAALGGSQEDSLGQIVETLSARPHLLFLDNGEHVLDAVAELVETLMQRVPDQMILLTSREPMRIEGEWVYRLPPLDLPTQIANVASSAACQLFAERAKAVRNDFKLNGDNAEAVADICRTLDGMPLAIELAASRSDLMTSRDISEALGDRFALLTRGRRTALPRHQTLRAALDWSYGLLDARQQGILDRLSVFQGHFQLEDAGAVAAGSPHVIRDTLHELVSKSLVVRDNGGFRLLETTRHYGLQCLRDSGALRAAREAHADRLLTTMADTALAWEGSAQRNWLTGKARYLEDMRAALDWAEADSEGGTLTLRLLIQGAPLWFHLSLVSEYLSRAEHLLAVLDDDHADSELVELLNGYGHALWHVRGPVPDMGNAFIRAFSVAQKLEDEPRALRSLWGIWAHAILAGDYVTSLAHAEAFSARLPADTPLSNRQTADHMRSLSHHFLGNHETALDLLESLMRLDAVPERETHANHAQVDGEIAALSLLMRLQWLLGDLPAALELARTCAAAAAELDHALSLSYGLAIGCIPVALAAGEAEFAEELLQTLHTTTSRHGLRHWRTFVDGYRGLPTPEASAMQREMFAVARGEKAAVSWFRAHTA
jgi:predicted ATPase